MWKSLLIPQLPYGGSDSLLARLGVSREATAGYASSWSAIGSPKTELMRSKRLLCEICRLMLELWRDDAPSKWAISWRCWHIRGTTCRDQEGMGGKRSSEGKEFQWSLTLTLTSFFSRAFPSGNFSPKHMLMVYSGDPPLFSLNSFSSVQRRDCQHWQINK